MITRLPYLRLHLLLAVMLLFGLSATVKAQEARVPPAAEQAQPSSVAKDSGASTESGKFYDKEMDLRFNYPVEMRTLDMVADMEAGHMNIYGSSGDSDPEHREARRCIRPLLDAELPAEKAPSRLASLQDIWVDQTREYKDSYKPQPIFAKLVLIEFEPGCLPKKLQKGKKVDEVLHSMALSAVSEPGLEPMPKPIWYEIGKQKIHMNSSAGRPIMNGKLDPAPVIIMAMATEWRGHLLEWVFTANDTEIFNEITKSLVRFGDGPWSQIFAPNIGAKGQGTPITILPK